MKRLALLAITAAGLVGLLGGCDSASPPQSPTSLSDAASEPVLHLTEPALIATTSVPPLKAVELGPFDVPTRTWRIAWRMQDSYAPDLRVSVWREGRKPEVLAFNSEGLEGSRLVATGPGRFSLQATASASAVDLTVTAEPGEGG